MQKFQECQPNKLSSYKLKFNENGPYYYRKQTNGYYLNETKKKSRKLEQIT